MPGKGLGISREQYDVLYIFALRVVNWQRRFDITKEGRLGLIMALEQAKNGRPALLENNAEWVAYAQQVATDAYTQASTSKERSALAHLRATLHPKASTSEYYQRRHPGGSSGVFGKWDLPHIERKPPAEITVTGDTITDAVALLREAFSEYRWRGGLQLALKFRKSIEGYLTARLNRKPAYNDVSLFLNGQEGLSLQSVLGWNLETVQEVVRRARDIGAFSTSFGGDVEVESRGREGKEKRARLEARRPMGK